MRNARTITILFSSVILFLMFGCTVAEQSEIEPVEAPHVEDHNINGSYVGEITEFPCNEQYFECEYLDTSVSEIEEELIKFIFPENLLGGRTAEATVDDFIATWEESQAILTDAFANADGTMTRLQTREQLAQSKYNLRTFSMFHEREYVTTIKDVIFTDDEMLTEITVLVDPYRYIWHMLERTMIQGALVVSAGTYQILNGVAPDDWHTTITVKDYETGEIVSITEFPHDDMFTIHIGND